MVPMLVCCIVRIVSVLILLFLFKHAPRLLPDFSAKAACSQSSSDCSPNSCAIDCHFVGHAYDLSEKRMASFHSLVQPRELWLSPVTKKQQYSGPQQGVNYLIT